MYDLAALNAARSHRRHGKHHGEHHAGRHHRRHRAMGTGEMAYFGGQKAAEAGVGAWLGYTDSYSGEPQFFQTSSDPTSGIGLKAMLAILANVAQFAQLWSGYSMSKLAGPTFGKLLDGGIAGTASASFSTYMYAQGNTYGTAKRQKEGGASGTTTHGLDYSRPMELPPARSSYAATAGVAEVGEDEKVRRGVASAKSNPFLGYM